MVAMLSSQRRSQNSPSAHHDVRLEIYPSFPPIRDNDCGRYGDHPVVIRAVGRMCAFICVDSACATLLRDLDLM